MASRSRPRGGSANDNATQQEEQLMWDSIKGSFKKLATIQNRQRELAAQIKELEEAAKEKEKNDTGPTVAEIDALSDLYRELLRITNEEKRMLNEEPHDVIHNVEILCALRKASSEEQMLSVNVPLHPRSASHSKARKPKPLVKPSSAAAAAAAAGGAGGASSSAASTAAAAAAAKDEEAGGADAKGAGGEGGIDGASEAPGAPGLSRVKGSSSVRSASLQSRRDGTVDRELKPPGSSSGAGGAGDDGPASEQSRGMNAERSGRLTKGAEVAYKQAKARDDGSQWIQCTIKQITEKGSVKRYEVQDLFPDENSGEMSIYKASVHSLIAIPKERESLPDYPVGKQVLALYPDTNTFYRAEVLGTKKRDGATYCRLKFEDEDETNKESEVLRRYVLDVASK